MPRARKMPRGRARVPWGEGRRPSRHYGQIKLCDHYDAKLRPAHVLTQMARAKRLPGPYVLWTTWMGTREGVAESNVVDVGVIPPGVRVGERERKAVRGA